MTISFVGLLAIGLIILAGVILFGFLALQSFRN